MVFFIQTFIKLMDQLFLKSDRMELRLLIYIVVRTLKRSYDIQASIHSDPHPKLFRNIVKCDLIDMRAQE